jgi:hypothetical protein
MIDVRTFVQVSEVLAQYELRACEQVPASIVADDRPVVFEPHQRWHREDCDKGNDHHIRPSER